MTSKLSIGSVARLENARYGFISVGKEKMTGALTDLAKEADGTAGTPKDGFIDKPELAAYQASIDANTKWSPLLKEAQSERVHELLGYVEHPSKLLIETAKATVEAPLKDAMLMLMMGGNKG
jgi:hypothetical protein